MNPGLGEERVESNNISVETPTGTRQTSILKLSSPAHYDQILESRLLESRLVESRLVESREM